MKRQCLQALSITWSNHLGFNELKSLCFSGHQLSLFWNRTMRTCQEVVTKLTWVACKWSSLTGRQLRSLCGSQTRLQVLPIPVHQEWLFLLLISISLYLSHMPQSGWRKEQQTTRHCRSVQSALYQVAHPRWPPEPFCHHRNPLIPRPSRVRLRPLALIWPQTR